MPDFAVPDLGEGLEDVTVVAWRVAVGDRVELNDVLCSVETAKAEVDLPSPFAGTVVALGGAEGDTLAVGALLARVEAAAVAGGPAGAPASSPAPPPAATPTLVGYGHDGALDRSRRSPADRSRTPDPAAARPERPARSSRPDGPLPPERPARSTRPRAKPPVRRRARHLGVDLRTTDPTGPDGIIIRADVEAAAGVGAAVPVRGVRARIAEHLATAHATIPDASARLIVDCTRLLEVRAALDGHAARRGLDRVVTPFTLLAHLAVTALAADPVLNATWEPDGPAVRTHDAVHLGVATATDRGLVVAVVRDADRRGVHDLSAETARLAAAARAGTATPADLRGSTFTITNFGALGLDDGTPIINHPEAAILGVGAIRRRPHVVDDEVVARSTAALTLVFDHRVADGAEAARLLTAVRDLIEQPELALLG